MKRRPKIFVSVAVAILTFGALTSHFGWRHHFKHHNRHASHCEKSQEIQKNNNLKN